jgi:hypothetical protein
MLALDQARQMLRQLRAGGRPSVEAFYLATAATANVLFDAIGSG